MPICQACGAHFSDDATTVKISSVVYDEEKKTYTAVEGSKVVSKDFLSTRVCGLTTKPELCLNSSEAIVEDEEWKNMDDPDIANWERNITKIGQLFDVSPVYTAAYSATSVYARSIENVENEVRAEKAAKEPEPEPVKDPEPTVKDDYYNDLDKQINI